MKLVIKAVFIFFLTLQCLAQESYYDSIYRETALIHIASNPEKALSNVNLLYSISEDNNKKLKSLLIKAELLRRYGVKNEAINILLKADSIAILENDYVSQTKTNGLLATIYRESNLQASGDKHIQRAKEASEKIQDKNSKLRFQGNLAQESAYLEMDKNNHRKAIEEIRKGNNYILEIASLIDLPYQLALNNMIIGESFLSLNKLDSAFHYLKNSKLKLSQSQSINSPMKGFVFKGLAEVYFAKEEYEKAEEYFLEAKSIADSSNFFELKKIVYRSISRFYKDVERSDLYITFNEKYIQLIANQERTQKVVADKLINSLYLKDEYSESANEQKKSVIYTLISVLVNVVALLSWFIYVRKKNQKKFQAFLEEKYKLKKPLTTTKSKPQTEKDYISKDREESILKTLKKIEKTKFYLDKNISLSILTGLVGVNQRYLTYVIKKHKNADFATYVNDLRINYIVNCIKEDPKYLKYKISYLAELCGFSSHSRFTINFKKTTGTTPSVFITYVTDENEKKEKLSLAN